MTLRLAISTACVVVLAFLPRGQAQMRRPDRFDLQSCSVLDGAVYHGRGQTGGVHVEVHRFSDPLAQSTGINNGSFTFNCLIAGSYDLRVIDAQGKIIHAEQLEVSHGSNSVQVIIPGSHTGPADSQCIRAPTDAQARRKSRAGHAQGLCRSGTLQVR